MGRHTAPQTAMRRPQHRLHWRAHCCEITSWLGITQQHGLPHVQSWRDPVASSNPEGSQCTQVSPRATWSCSLHKPNLVTEVAARHHSLAGKDHTPHTIPANHRRRLGTTLAKHVAPKMGPYSGPKTGPQGVKPDCWASEFEAQIWGRKMDPFWGPFLEASTQKKLPHLDSAGAQMNLLALSIAT